jgi:hypothetical protein
MTTTAKEFSGVGHQLKADQKAIQSALHSLESAYGDLTPLHVAGSFGFDMTQVMNDLRIVSLQLERMKYACQERYNQND